MEKTERNPQQRLTYFDLAENDYQYLKRDFDEKRVGNLLCYSAQSICERFLKHIIDCYAPNRNNTDILKTHSLTRLVNFIEDTVEDFSCNWNNVLLADGYYFSARYPGTDTVLVKSRDVDNCILAVNTVRDAVIQYEKEKNKENEEDAPKTPENILNTREVSSALIDFDEAEEFDEAEYPPRISY